MRTGVYPGSFNPPTVAHLTIAVAARQQRHLDNVTLMISRQALAKEDVEYPLLEHRLQVLAEVGQALEWLTVSMTDHQLLVDVAEGFDVLILGADKYEQIQEPHWYNDEEHRTAALAGLPELAIAPRPPHGAPAELLLALDLDATALVSSTAARSGALEHMVPEARKFAASTGAWIDEQRYLAWLADRA